MSQESIALQVLADNRTVSIEHGGIRTVHQFDQRSLDAINAALISGRPLLVRGEPGVGKTQLAEAAAEVTKRAFLRFTVDGRTEARDLLWRFDAVMRLAEAQILAAKISALYSEQRRDSSSEEPSSDQGEKRQEIDRLLQEELDIRRFVRPGPLWWAFNAADAGDGCPPEENMLDDRDNRNRSKSGWVILIDEIDKADSDLPNGLLEALGERSFRPLGRSTPVSIPADLPDPLVIVTTNEDRVLPDAFVRRCLALHLQLPDKRPSLIEHLVSRGRVHFKDQTTEDVLKEAAVMLAEDRDKAKDLQLKPLPGQAEYLDLLRAVVGWKEDPKEQLSILGTVRTYVFRKHKALLDESELEPEGSE